MNRMWADGMNDRDWADVREDPELCPHGKPALCDACVEAFQEWARQQNRKAALECAEERIARMDSLQWVSRSVLEEEEEQA